jgi:hypothetical protein
MRYLILLLLVGCAAMTEDEKIDREYAYAELVSEYLESKAECKMAGGVWITRYSQRRHYKPKPHELWSAYCTSRADLRL